MRVKNTPCARRQTRIGYPVVEYLQYTLRGWKKKQSSDISAARRR